MNNTSDLHRKLAKRLKSAVKPQTVNVKSTPTLLDRYSGDINSLVSKNVKADNEKKSPVPGTTFGS